MAVKRWISLAKAQLVRGGGTPKEASEVDVAAVASAGLLDVDGLEALERRSERYAGRLE